MSPEIKKLSFKLLAVGVLCLLAPMAVADEIWVIASQSAPNSSLTRTEAASLFMGMWGENSGLYPFDQADAELRARFYMEVAGLSPHSVRAHWSRLVFTGRKRPPPMLKPEEIGKTLESYSGAVTYVLSGQLPAGSKVLLVLKQEAQK